jgi:archaellum biogenesis ATPase FlaH
MKMDPENSEPTSVIEEFLSHLRPITQLALLNFMQKNAMLTAQQMVVLSDVELEKLLEVGNISYLYQNPQYGVNTLNYKVFLRSAIRELWSAACKVSSPISELSTLESAYISYSSLPRLKFGDKVLDEKIGACFPAKGIVDVVGEASAGKTQFCLHLLINCITPLEHGGIGKGALYIHTEGEFAHKRWEQLKQFRLLSMSNGNHLLEDQLVIQRISTVEDMDALLERLRPLIRVKSCAVVIIDSIAALVRDLPTDAKQATLYRWSSHLQETSDDTGIPIITTNQVVDFIDEPSYGASSSLSHPKSSYGVAKRHSSFMATGRRVLPALGLRWSEIVNSRIALTRTSQRYDGPVQLSKIPAGEALEADSRGSESIEDFMPGSKRKKLNEASHSLNRSTPQSWEDAAVIVRHIQVLFSPAVADLQADYFIDGAGLHGIS